MDKMPQTRGKVKDYIREALKEALEAKNPRPLKFTEIRNTVEEKSKSRCYDRVLSYNLARLKEEGEIERADGGWRLTRSYWTAQAQKSIESILKDDLSVGFGHPDLAPSFMLASGRFAEMKLQVGVADTALDKLAQGHFGSEIDGFLFGMPEKKRAAILGYAARCLWLGATLWELEGEEIMKKDSTHRELHERVEKRLEKRYGKRRARDNLENLLRAIAVEDKYGDEMLAHHMLEGMNRALEDDGPAYSEDQVACGVKLSSIPLSAHQARLLALSFAHTLAGSVLSPKDEADIRLREFIDWVEGVGRHHLVFSHDEADGIAEQAREFFRRLEPKFKHATAEWEKHTKRELEDTATIGLKEWDRKAKAIVKKGKMVGYYVNISAVAHWVVRNTPTNPKETLEWLRKHKQEFLDFLKDVEKVRFVHISAVGHPKLEEWPMSFLIPERVDSFMGALEQALSWDGRIPELEALAREADRIAYRLDHGKKPGEVRNGLVEYAFAYAFGPWATPLRLYNYDRRTRDARWWLKFKGKIEKALEEKTSPRSRRRAHTFVASMGKRGKKRQKRGKKKN